MDTGDALDWKCNPRSVTESNIKAIDLAMNELFDIREM